MYVSFKTVAFCFILTLAQAVGGTDLEIGLTSGSSTVFLRQGNSLYQSDAIEYRLTPSSSSISLNKIEFGDNQSYNWCLLKDGTVNWFSFTAKQEVDSLNSLDQKAAVAAIDGSICVPYGRAVLIKEFDLPATIPPAFNVTRHSLSGKLCIISSPEVKEGANFTSVIFDLKNGETQSRISNNDYDSGLIIDQMDWLNERFVICVGKTRSCVFFDIIDLSRNSVIRGGEIADQKGIVSVGFDEKAIKIVRNIEDEGFQIELIPFDKLSPKER